MAPTLVVLAVVGYCCWTDGEEPTPGAKAKATAGKPTLTPAMLSPAAAPVPERDPFHAQSGAPPEDQSGKKVPTAAPVASGPSTAAIPDLNRLVKGLVLQATFVRGNRRVALIDGNLYAEGDAVRPSKALATPFMVAQVLPHKVVLRQAAQTVELKYPDSAAKANSPPSREPANASGKANAKAPGQAGRP